MKPNNKRSPAKISMYDNSKRGTRNVRSENLNEALNETSEKFDNVSSIHFCLQILLAMKIVEMTKVFIPCNSVGNNFKLKEKLFLMIKGKQDMNMMKV